MKKTSITALCLFAATPGLAHNGAHLHPHGAENWLAVLVLSLGGAAVAGLALAHARRRK
jgi:hypothetical protein